MPPSISRASSTRPLPRLLRGGSHAVVWLYAALLAIPLYYLIVSGFKDNSQIFGAPFSLPGARMTVTSGASRAVEQTGFQNFTEAFRTIDLGIALWNSTVVTVGSLALTLCLAIPAAYGLARSSGRTSTLMERYFALGFLIPGFAALVPAVLLSIQMGLFQTRSFLILVYPASALPLSVILLTQFMRTIPTELEESALIDGASRFDVLWRIYVPLITPGIASVLILNFLSFWNEFLYALVVTGINSRIRTAQVAIPNLIRESTTEFGVLAAGTIISVIPVYLLYIALQKRMETALTDGAVKG